MATMTDDVAMTAEKNSGYAMQLRTMQSSTFKNMIDVLKDELMDTPIEFDKTGMKIIALNPTRSVLVHVFFPAEKFEYYKCDRKLLIGVNIMHFHKVIRQVTNEEILTMSMYAADLNILEIERIDKKGRHSTMRFKLIDLGSEKLDPESMKFRKVTSMLATEFHKICRDMSALAEYMEIKDVGNQLIFSCVGEFCSQDSVIYEPRGEEEEEDDVETRDVGNNNASDIVQGVFEMKHLNIFSKCFNLSTTVVIMLENELPMLVKYESSLGDIKFLLASHIDEEEDNDDEQ